jgi:hypothetical protein
MDSILKELKQHRETVELEFNKGLEQIAKVQRELDASADAKPSYPTRSELAALANSSEKLFRKMHMLANARSAELARQLTVLPLSRMDHMIDSIEKRMESLESRLARLEKS